MGCTCRELVRPYVMRMSTEEYYCLICNSNILGKTSLDIHLNTTHHNFAVQSSCFLSPIEVDDYHCKCCDSVITGYNNVHSHMQTDGHQSLLGSEAKNVFHERETIDWSKCKHFASPFVATESENQFYCMLCDQDIYRHAAFQAHINSCSHDVAVKLYGLDISPLVHIAYYCKCCNDTIYNYNAVNYHTNGEKHQNAIVELRRQRIMATETTINFVPNFPQVYCQPFPYFNTGLQYPPMNSYNYRLTYMQFPENPGTFSYNLPYGNFAPRNPGNFFRGLPLQANFTFPKATKRVLPTPAKLVEIRDETEKQLPMPANSSVPEAAKYSLVTLEQYDNIKDDEKKQRKLEVHSKPSSPDYTKNIPERATTPPRLDVASWQFSAFRSLVTPEKYDDTKDDGKKQQKPEVHSKPSSPDCTKNIPKRTKTPPRLDVASWQFSSCSNLLVNSCVKSQVADPWKMHSKEATNGYEKMKNNDETQLEDNGKPEFNNFCKLRSRDVLNGYEKFTNYCEKKLEHNGQSEIDGPCELRSKEVTNGFEKMNNYYEKQLERNGQSGVDDPRELRSREVTNGFEKMNNYCEKHLEHNGQPEVKQSSEENCPETKQCLSKKTDTKEIEHLFDFDEEDIYNMRDRLQEIKRGMDLCFVTRTNKIYCLVCCKMVDNKLENYFEHLCNLDHCEYLEIMLQNFARIDLDRSQFSELYLAYQYIEEVSKDVTRCLVCNKDICNIDYALEHHIDDVTHRLNCEKMHAKTQQSFEDMAPRMQCDWYKVQKYWCVPCSATFDTEIPFVEHLQSEEHENQIEKSKINERELIYDFCDLCALLWYGYRSTYGTHCDSFLHKWFIHHGHYVLSELPEAAKLLLAMPEKYVEGTINYLDQEVSVKRRNQMIVDLVKAVKFPRAIAYVFGSRIADSRLPDGDIDILLSCGNIYDGKNYTKNQISYFLTHVHECLMKDPETWDVKNLVVNDQSPIIKTRHRPTDFFCDISFEIGLVAGGTQFIKFLNYVFAAFRKLILFLKQWLAYCVLSGSENITNWALYWCVIFYLQTESLLPSIGRLIATIEKPIIADGRQTVPDDLMYDKAASDKFSLKELLVKFFTFYANFNFRDEVACPLLGEAVKKQAFADPKNLPKEMASHITRVGNSKFEEWFTNDSAMSVQDPFNLQHNITKGVSKVCLSRFRICCAESLHVLCPSTKTH